MIRGAIILGAGVAGLACATVLSQAGVAVTVLDKGRRPGGRVATRRADGVAFNHGAQFATVHGAAFGALVRDLEAAGEAAEWPEAGAGRYAFLPGMSALPASLARSALGAGVGLRMERHAGFVHAAASGWTVRHFPSAEMRPGQTADVGGELTDPAEAVLLAMPAPQAGALLRTVGHRFAAAMDRCVMAPCWTVMARFDGAVPGGSVIKADSGPIAWAARESSRPGGAGQAEAWTIQAGPDWSRTHLEAPAEDVCDRLLDAFRNLAGAPAAVWVRGHRWRHALVETPLGEPCLWDPRAGVGACGDWCVGGRIEAAYDSGVRLAARVLDV